MSLAEIVASSRWRDAAEIVAVMLAIAYLVLAIRENVLCWLAAFLSSALYLAVFFAARLYMESVLQVFYAAMAVYGYRQWRYGGAQHSGLAITTWSLRRHALALGIVAVASLAIGGLMSRTNAAFPFVDAFTTSGAIVTTYMVARKILENWLYWFVIDGVSVFLYMARDLNFTAALFVLYLVLIVIGFTRWHREWRGS